jgi:hypothetical protein
MFRFPSLVSLAFLVLCVPLRSADQAPWRTDPERRKEGRPAELWQVYMHGVADFFATPVAARFPKTPAETVTIDTPFTPKARHAAFRLSAGQSRVSEALPVDLAPLSGGKVRLFYWMRGENTGRRPTTNSYGDAPQLHAIVKDAAGRQLSKIVSHNGAVGTHPWHGYYLDVQLSAQAKSLHVEITNPQGGVAWFTRFAYEPVTEQNTFSSAEKQDPETGSLAAFPRYEAINFHLFAKPPAVLHTWNFLRGPAAGMIGQPYDLTTLEGLRRYYRESAKVDLDQLNHGIMYFPMRYHQAKAGDALPPMEDGWLEEVARLVLEDQDPEAGYWGTHSLPHSMSVTFHFVDMLFAFGIERTDTPPRPDPRRCIAPALPRAEQMVRTTLRLQSTRDGRPAAWSAAAYNFTTKPDGSANRCQLGSSMNAIRLLRIARQFVGPELQAEIDASIEGAFRYMLETVVAPSGVWKQEDTDKAPSKAAYWANIVNFSPWLEPRRSDALAAPQIEKTDDGLLRVVDWPEDQNSVRIYRSTTEEDLGPARIVGIVSRGDDVIRHLDPYVAVRRMATAAKDTWGVRSFGGSNSYVYAKVFRQLPKTFPAVLKDQPLKPATGKGGRLFATAVDWYGRESAPVEIR